MDLDWQRILEAIGTAIVIATTLGISRWSVRTIKARNEKEDERDVKIQKLLDYHEGTPGEPKEGKPAVPGIQERIEHIEMEIQPNGGDTGTIGDRMERTEKLAEKAVGQNQQIWELASKHVENHRMLMRIRDHNEQTLRAALHEAGIDLPDYIRSPETLDDEGNPHGPV